MTYTGYEVSYGNFYVSGLEVSDANDPLATVKVALTLDPDEALAFDGDSARRIRAMLLKDLPDGTSEESIDLVEVEIEIPGDEEPKS